MKNKKVKILYCNFFPKNHRGAMEIVLLVLLVFLVVSVALFTFIVNPSSAKVNVYDSRFVENVYQKQELAEFYIRQVGEDVIAKNSGKDFSENFKTEFSKYDFAAPQAYPETSSEKMSTGGKDYLKELQKIIQEGEFNVFVVSNVLEIQINSWELKDSFEQNQVKKIQITYTPKIFVKFDLKN